MSDNQEFKVNDNRMFNPDGSLKEEVPQGPSQETDNPKVQQENQTTQQAEDDSPFSQGGPIDFSTFILSLASSVQISMGIVPNPMTGTVNKDLNHAKQTIDILGMLEEKTAGNLNPEESGMLKNILYQLRMQFVEIQKQ